MLFIFYYARTNNFWFSQACFIGQKYRLMTKSNKQVPNSEISLYHVAAYDWLPESARQFDWLLNMDLLNSNWVFFILNRSVGV